jgi:lysophospholipase L1-like esterase
MYKQLVLREGRAPPCTPRGREERRVMPSMWKPSWIVVALCALLPASALAQQSADAAPAPGVSAPVTGVTVPPLGPGRGRGPRPPLPPATEPRPRADARHQAFLEVARAANIDVLFVGDSITDWWRQANRGLPVWNEYFAPLRAANFGIAGDTTQGVLWRMQNGELDGFQAKLIVLMLGTNNINRNPDEQIADGNRAIVAEFLKRQPQAKVLLLGIFPRGAQPGNPFRASIQTINDRLATFADNDRIFYMDIGAQFLLTDGTLPADVMPDGLHPNEKGYRIWAEAVIARVKELMQ